MLRICPTALVKKLYSFRSKVYGILTHPVFTNYSVGLTWRRSTLKNTTQPCQLPGSFNLSWIYVLTRSSSLWQCKPTHGWKAHHHHSNLAERIERVFFFYFCSWHPFGIWYIHSTYGWSQLENKQYLITTWAWLTGPLSWLVERTSWKKGRKMKQNGLEGEKS